VADAVGDGVGVVDAVGDLVADCADELDMDVVAYAMSLVVEYGAL